jgi:thiamine pyrophosphate-dependent acetolactate synthase large subunit-like protein
MSLPALEVTPPGFVDEIVLPEDRSQESYPHPSRILSAMTKYMRAQDVLCVDTGDVTLWTSLCLKLTKGSVTLSSERLGTMGYGFCAAIAASLEKGPGSKAVVVAGDGGFQMTMNELGTAVQNSANILIVVLDNGRLGRVEFGFNDAKGCGLAGCDWVAVAKAYGAEGMAVHSDADIDAALRAGFAHVGVFIIAAYIDPDLKAEMAAPSSEDASNIARTPSKDVSWLRTSQKVDCA